MTEDKQQGIEPENSNDDEQKLLETDDVQRYENDEQQENGTEIVPSNRDDKGQWLDRSDSPLALFDSNTGRDAANKRWQDYRDATVEGVVTKAREIFPDDNIRTPYEAWQKIAEAQYEHALKNPPSAKLIQQSLDALPRGGGSVGEASVTIEKQQVIIMIPFRGMPKVIQELANKIRAEGDEKTAAYIEAQIEQDNENEQRVEYPREIKQWPKRR